MDLDANDELPTKPSGVLLEYSDGIGLTGAVQSVERP